jgi:geranylgeranyl diphosphate synthase type I
MTGKSVATDIVSRKKSLPVLYGLSKSNQLSHIYQTDALGEDRVEEAIRVLDSISAKDYAQQTETQYYQQAVDSLQQANPRGEAADWLMQLVNTLFQREY